LRTTEGSNSAQTEEITDCIGSIIPFRVIDFITYWYATEYSADADVGFSGKSDM